MSYLSKQGLSVSQYLAIRKSLKAELDNQASDPSKFKMVVEPFKPPIMDQGALAINTAEAMRQYISAIPGFTLINSINAATPGIQIPPAASGVTVTNPFMTFTFGKTDGLIINCIQNADSNVVSNDFKSSVNVLINEHYVGSGTAAGLFRRITSQIPKKMSPAVTEDDLVFALAHLPRRDTAILSGEGASLITLDPVLNFDAHPGAPYFVSGVTLGDVFETEIQRASEYLVILSKGGARALHKHFEANPAFCPMMLCPKRDLYTRAQYYTKTRPFGVTPAGLRIIFTAIAKAIDPQQENFVENPKSSTAFGFSWAKGGAQKLWDFVSSPRPPGYYFLSWGDDQIVVVVLVDGSSFVLNPDVLGMDMKVDENSFMLFRAWCLQQFSSAPVTLAMLRDKDAFKKWALDPRTRLDQRWLNAILYFNDYLAAHNVLTYKHYVFRQMKGLLSGLNMTTPVDVIASMRLNKRLSEVPRPLTGTATNVQKYIKDLGEAALAIGFPLKTETMHFQPIRKPGGQLTSKTLTVSPDGVTTTHTSDVRLALDFLGMSVRTFTFSAEVTTSGLPITILVPTQDGKQILLKAAYNGMDDKDPLVRAGKQQNALLGQGLQAFNCPEAYTILKAAYEMRVKMGMRALKSNEILEGFDGNVIDDIIGARTYPSREWYAKHFADPSLYGELKNIPPPTQIGDEVQESTAVVLPQSTISYADPFAEDDEVSLIPDIRSQVLSNLMPPSLASFFAQPVAQPIHTIRVLAPLAPTKPPMKPKNPKTVSFPASAPPPIPPKPKGGLRALTSQPLTLKAFEVVQDNEAEAEVEPLAPVLQKTQVPPPPTHPGRLPPIPAVQIANKRRYLEKRMAAIKIRVEQRKERRDDPFSQLTPKEEADMAEEDEEDYQEYEQHLDELHDMDHVQEEEAMRRAQERAEEEDKAAGHAAPNDPASLYEPDAPLVDPFGDDDVETAEEKYHDPSQSRKHQAAAYFRD